MAYHLGRIIHEEWGHDLVSVEISPEMERHSVWSYDCIARTVTWEDMKRQAGCRDVLVCNPSFSDRSPGLSFPGLKLMFVQGMNTFSVIDGFFDKYVAVSPFVAAFMRRTYGMALPVIAPFIHHDQLPRVLPAWEDRPNGSVMVLDKSGFYDHFMSVLNAKHPGVAFSETHVPLDTPHCEFLRIMSRNRYLLQLSALEGFGLPALEAMMCGTAVVGFHGGGGRSYYLAGWRENAFMCGFPDFRRLADLFVKMLSDDARAKRLARRGRRTAAGYTYEKFKRAWIKELTPLLGSRLMTGNYGSGKLAPASQSAGSAAGWKGAS